MRLHFQTTTHTRLPAVCFFVALLAIVCVSCSTARHPHHGASSSDAPSICREGTPGSSVRWIDASTGDDQTTNEAWCRSVGGWVVADHLPRKSTAPIDSLLIVTWNTYIGGGDLVPFVEDLRAGRLTSGIAPSHFILLLQEVYRASPDVPREIPDGVTLPRGYDHVPPSGERMDILSNADRLGLWVFYVPSMRNGDPDERPMQEDRGNAILATMPLDDLTAIVLPFEKYRRVALAATAMVMTSTGETERIRICNVHFDNRARFPRYLQSAGVGRYRQAKALLPYISEAPGVLGGDFNTWAPSPLETAVPFLREVYTQPDELLDKPTAVVPIIPDRRIDYILFNLPADMWGEYSRVEERYGSDHYALLGWLHWNGPKP